MHFDWDNFLMGATLLGIIAHGVNSFPTPKNVYGQWFLGIIKFAVGQRLSAMNVMQGKDTVSIAVAQGTVAGIQSKSSSMSVGESSITIDEKKHTVIPTVPGTGE